MTAIVRERTARREHRCGRCRLPIKPGTRYADVRIPPDSTWSMGSEHWRRERSHLTYDECEWRPCESRQCPLTAADAGRRCLCEALETAGLS